MLISYARKFRRWLHRVATEYKNEIAHAPHPDNATVEKKSPETFIAELHVSDATIDRIKAQSKREKRHEIFKDTIETLMFGVIALYTLFTWAMWKDLNTQNLNQSTATINAAVNSDRSFQQTQDQFRMDQRAWVGPKQFAHTNVSEGRPEIAVYLQNTGKTPALDFLDGGEIKAFAKGKFKPIYPKDTHECATKHQPLSARDNSKWERASISKSTVFPQQELTLIQRDDVGFIPSISPQLKTGDMILYIYGWASYKDAFAQPHCTHFCSYLATNLVDMPACSTYNDAD